MCRDQFQVNPTLSSLPISYGPMTSILGQLIEAFMSILPKREPHSTKNCPRFDITQTVGFAMKFLDK